MGGGHADSSQDGRSVQRISAENCIVAALETQSHREGGHCYMLKAIDREFVTSAKKIREF